MSMRLMCSLKIRGRRTNSCQGLSRLARSRERECDRGGGEGTERAGLSWVLRLSCVRYEEQLRGKEDGKTSKQGHRKEKKANDNKAKWKDGVGKLTCMVLTHNIYVTRAPWSHEGV